MIGITNVDALCSYRTVQRITVYLNNDFLVSPLEFEDRAYRDVFAAKNKKTIAETLEHLRYAGLKDELISAHPKPY